MSHFAHRRWSTPGPCPPPVAALVRLRVRDQHPDDLPAILFFLLLLFLFLLLVSLRNLLLLLLVRLLYASFNYFCKLVYLLFAVPRVGRTCWIRCLAPPVY